MKPSDQLTLGLSYVNSYNRTFTTGSNRANSLQTLGNFSSNSYGVQANWKFNPKLAIGGWVGYSNNQIISGNKGSAEIWTWAVNLAFPDLGKKGNLGGIIVGMEPKVTSVSNSLSALYGKDGDTSLHIEGFYQHQLNDNISITPGIIWLTAPDHNERNKDLVIGVIRTTFTF